MIVAHLPAGYLLSRGIMKLAGKGKESVRTLLAWGMVSSILPDIDLIYGALVDHGLVPHHRYLTHWPSFWFSLVVVWALLMVCGVLRSRWHLMTIVALNVFGHLFLDWIVSTMWLLEPFSHEAFNLVVVPRRYHPWYLNFLLFWTAWLEAGILLAAVILALHDYRKSGKDGHGAATVGHALTSE